MISWKQAVESAREAAKDMLPYSEYTVEELEKEEYRGREVWSITLGMPSMGPGYRRDYKRFLVDSETGEFVAMQLRPVA